MEETTQIQAQPVDFQICRFTVDKPLYAGGAAHFGSKEKAKGSPLPERLFEIEEIAGVLVAENRVIVEKKTTDWDWQPVGKKVGAAIRAHLNSGLPAVSKEVTARMPSEKDLFEQIQSILENQINPSVAAHGGHVDLLDVKKNNVYIQLSGGCQGCGMALVTLKQGIERVIRDAIPEVGEILDTTDHAGGLNPYYARS